MKKIKSLLIVLSVFSACFLIFTACDNKDSITNPGITDFNSAQFALFDNTDAENGIEDATLDNDLQFNNTLYSMNFGGGPMMNSMDGRNGMKGATWFDKYDFGKHLGRIFRALNLTDDQITQVKGFMKDYHESLKMILTDFRASTKDIVTAANAERKDIITKLKNGEITRAQAGQQIKELNQKTRDQIKNTAASAELKKQMCELRVELFGKISTILTTDDQSSKWVIYTSKFPAC